MSQYFEVQVYDVFAIRGNAAIFKCQVPSFVADHVDVAGWIDSEGGNYRAEDEHASYGTDESKSHVHPVYTSMVLARIARSYSLLRLKKKIEKRTSSILILFFTYVFDQRLCIFFPLIVFSYLDQFFAHLSTIFLYFFQVQGQTRDKSAS